MSREVAKGGANFLHDEDVCRMSSHRSEQAHDSAGFHDGHPVCVCSPRMSLAHANDLLEQGTIEEGQVEETRTRMEDKVSMIGKRLHRRENPSDGAFLGQSHTIDRC